MAPFFKVSDIAKTASLLKKLIDASDVNSDGAVRLKEARYGDKLNGLGIQPKKPTAAQKNTAGPGATLEAVVRFSQANGSSEIPALKKTIDELAKRARAADRDGDGFINDNEQRAMSSGAEQSFVRFGAAYSNLKITDFILPTKHTGTLPKFSWAGTPDKVCTSLLNAFSERKNDNFWDGRGVSRYVISAAEAKKMVEALAPLYPARQKAVLEELAKRTLKSEFGCVFVSPDAVPVFKKLAADLGVTGLQFKAPKPPPAPHG
jgi:hypothetical protein